MSETDFLKWLVASRSNNQDSSLKLLNLLQKHKAFLRTDIVAAETISMLIAASFSLWRAVFLGEVKGGVDKMLDEAEGFLEYLVRDNIIMYMQDKKSAHWTFRYYVQNARDRLQRLERIETPKLYKISLDDVPPELTAQAWWNLNQQILNDAIDLIENPLNEGIHFRKSSTPPDPEKPVT